MNKNLRLVAVALLFFLGISALFGSYQLIIDPTGKSLQMPLGLLKPTPFENYLIPGILLFLTNGIPVILIGFISIKKIDHYEYFIILQGGILFLWLNAELIINIDFYYPLALVSYYIIAILLMGFGFKLRKS
ncbi:hypothetical protein ACKGJN_04525 [Gillisia sp. Q332]|uniref:hypothetical protein n=1 Tax=Gillisia xinjiangensis TaxID=3384765 RepID=UPI00391BFC72